MITLAGIKKIPTAISQRKQAINTTETEREKQKVYLQLYLHMIEALYFDFAERESKLQKVSDE